MVDYYEDLSKSINFGSLTDPTTKYELIHVIGEGTYGEVFEAKDRETGRKVAIKIMENISDNIEEVEEEYLILTNQSLHPNIPSFYGLYLKLGNRREEDQLWFVLELCSGGSVTDLVQGLCKKGEKLPERIIAYILRETIDALNYLHQSHIMHRDVKGHNILLTEEGVIKLIDFGVSSHLNNSQGKRNTSVGTPYWMAPEVIACERQLEYAYDVRCDVWSLGITAIELADGEPPLAQLHPMRALFHIPRNPPPKLKKPSCWSEIFNDFIAECLVKDYEQRPQMCELLLHPFIAQVDRKHDELAMELRNLMYKVRGCGYPKRVPEVTTKHGKLKVDRRSEPLAIIHDDLASLENLNQDIVINHLFERFKEGQIYTYIGDILVAVNPFRPLGIYDEKHSFMYRNKAKNENPPHVYALADSAYHQMLHHRRNQCIVISGESGAGKTESANFLLKHLVFLGKALNRNLEDKILEINRIMEAFGNAKTGINDNSSRFGKFLDVTFTKTGKVTGAKLYVYLLERSRVVWQQNGERNYHIFYYMYDGLAEEGRINDYFLHVHTDCRSHRFLGGNQHDANSIMRNVASFRAVKQSFQLLGFRAKDTDSILAILAAILHLGDIRFEEAEETHNSNKCKLTNPSIIPIVGQLLRIDANSLVTALTRNTVVTRGESIIKNHSVQEAETTRDAMAKAIYGRLFDWIVNQINRLLSPGRMVYGEPLAVGLLDIFGFENFRTNSFEQLCINIANEQMQYYFNQHIFRWEQQEYISEGIDVELIQFYDNKPVLDMFLGRPLGMLVLLDEETHFPNATDASLIEKFHSNIKSSFYLKPKSNALQFTVMHYAGKVTYDARNFLEKNRNYVPLEVIQLLRQSSVPIVKALFACPLTKTGHLYIGSEIDSSSSNDTPNKIDGLSNGKNGFDYDRNGLVSQTRTQQTVATYFRFSLMDLLHKLTNGAPHFVRCIKPNDSKLAMTLSREKIAEQLAYTGIMETIKIRQMGFSHRIPFAEFLRRYSFLVFSFEEKVVADRETCRLLLVRLGLDGWALGKTKVFLKYYHIEYLSRVYDEVVQKIIRVQAFARRWLAKKRAEKERWNVARSILIMQKYARGWLARKRMMEAKSKPNYGNNDGSSISPTSTPNQAKRARSYEANMMISSSSSTSSSSPLVHQHSNPNQSHNQQQQQHQRNGRCPYWQSPDKAAVLIQKYVRGYLTRKKVKPHLDENRRVIPAPIVPPHQRQIFANAKDYSKYNNHHGQYHHHLHQQQHLQQQKQEQLLSSKGNHFVAERMKMYQASVGVNNNQPSHQIWSRNQNVHNQLHSTRPQCLNIGPMTPNGKNEQRSTDNNDQYPAHFLLSSKIGIDYDVPYTLEDPWDAPLRNLEKNFNQPQAEIISVGKFLSEDYMLQQRLEHHEKENLISSKWWDLIKQTSGDILHDEKSGLASERYNKVKSNEPNEVISPKSVTSPSEANNAGSGKKVLVEVESWFQRCGGGQPYNISPETGSASDQGPYQFRKILKPTSTGTNKSDGSMRKASATEEFPFDFRKLLRRTEHAPTDTLKRCKGIMSPQ
ncbi:myosin-IIIb isoform X3 [Tetranychus urticae]|uniref:myosin-IIIb isoform X3 n=1 Tax=Tetranychus urticae TaxID=32264 RepID=UPI00077BE0F8|nr:myosin-IIIb isoform X3 [Tetranychus urticae]